MEEVISASFKALSQHLTGDAEENHTKLQSEQLLKECGRPETGGTNGIIVKSFTPESYL